MLLLIIVTSVVSGFIVAGGVFGVGSLFVRVICYWRWFMSIV